MNHFSSTLMCRSSIHKKNKTSSTLLQLYIKVSFHHSENAFRHEVQSYAEKHRNSSRGTERSHLFSTYHFPRKKIKASLVAAGGCSCCGASVGRQNRSLVGGTLASASWWPDKYLMVFIWWYGAIRIGIQRQDAHGCIRMQSRFYAEVKKKTPLKLFLNKKQVRT